MTTQTKPPLAAALDDILHDLSDCIENGLLNDPQEREWEDICEMDSIELALAFRDSGRGIHIGGLMRAAHVMLIHLGGTSAMLDAVADWDTDYRRKHLCTYLHWIEDCIA